MMRGSKPKPTHLKMVHGSRRPVRKNEPKPVGDLLQPPEWFNEAQKTEWTYVIASAPAGMLKRIDRNVVAAFVAHSVAFREASEQLNRSALLIKGARAAEVVQNPLLRIRRQESLLMMRAAAELGFTPSARTRIETVPDEPAEDEWAKILD